MEFAPSRHSFIVNGRAYNVTYLDPLNQWACSDNVSRERKWPWLRCLSQFKSSWDCFAFRFARAWSRMRMVHGGLAVMVGGISGDALAFLVAYP